MNGNGSPLRSKETGDYWLEFRPRPSRGRFWTTTIGLAVVLMFLIPAILAWNEAPHVLLVFLSIIGTAVAAPIFVVSWYAARMSYRFEGRDLVLSVGPLRNDRISVDSIESISIIDLRVSPLASFRFPGLVLFDVDVIGMSRMRMCATSATDHVMVIEAGSRRYGITPDDETGFIEAILERASSAIRVPERGDSAALQDNTISR